MITGVKRRRKKGGEYLNNYNCQTEHKNNILIILYDKLQTERNIFLYMKEIFKSLSLKAHIC